MVCTDRTLQLLVANGLPRRGTPTSPTFDYYDVVNVGLYARSGRSVPEVAQRMQTRYARGAPGTWTGARQWELLWDIRCTRQECPGGSWQVRLPAPDALGGTCGPVSCDLPMTASASTLSLDGASAMRLAIRVTTVGRATPVLGRSARRLYDDMLADLRTASLRYQ
jgi:hypothetical protein